MTSAPARPRWVAVLAAAALVLAAPPVAAARQAAETDPALEQTVDRDEAIVPGPATAAAGHVDIGPRFVDGRWRVLARDDTVVPAVWRGLDETVFQLTDASVLPVPDDPAYGFLGLAPGTAVHVVPQVEKQGVVWLGWNTQEPEVAASLDRGATLTLLDVEGPGELTVFLQSGNFGRPEVLWSSAEPAPQPLFVEVNSHVHANWVFSEPGVYVVEIELSATLLDGRGVSDASALRFAVGAAATPEQALAATYTPSPATGPAAPRAASSATGPEAAGSSPPWAVAAAGAAALLAGLAVAVLGGRRARRLAEAQRRGPGPPGPVGDARTGATP